MICNYETKITINDVEYEIECEIEFSVLESHYTTTKDSPEGLPTLEINEIMITRAWEADEDDNIVLTEFPEPCFVKKIIMEDEWAQKACRDHLNFYGEY